MPETTARWLTHLQMFVLFAKVRTLAILRAAKPWDIRADISVNIGNQVIFQGFNSNIPLVGRLNLTQRGYETAMRAMGAIGVSQSEN